MTFTLSAYRHSRDTKGVDVSLDAVVRRIQTGARGLDEKTKMCHVLAQTDKDAYRDYKEKELPAVTFAGIFPKGKRKANVLSVHSSLVVLDIDGLSEADIPLLLSELSQLPQVKLAFISPSGKGIKIVVLVSPVPKDDAEHKAAWQACVDFFENLAEEYGFEIDPTGKDCSRLCYLAYDAQAIFHAETVSIGWDRDAYLSECEAREKRRVELEGMEFSGDVDVSALDFISADDYEVWLTIGMAIHEAGLPCEAWDAWSQKSAKYETGACDKKWQSFGNFSGRRATWGSVVYLAEQNGYELPKRLRQKPIRLEKRSDVSLVTEALTTSWKFLSEAFEKGKGFIGLRSDTGTGKDHHAILHYQETAINGFYSVPTTEHAKETASRMNAAGLIEFRWRGIHSERDGTFPHESPCTQPDAYMAYLNSGRNAFELLCASRCPDIDVCLAHGFRSQEKKAKQAQVIVSAHRDLLFNPSFRHLAKRLLPKGAKDLTVINEFDCFDSFIDIQIPQSRLEYLAKTWDDHTLGTLAKLVLKACIFDENPIARIRELVDGLTHKEQQEVYMALTQYRIGDTIMSRDEAHAYEKRNPSKTLSDIIALPLIETDDWNMLIQLELFFDKYADDETAPLRWENNTLTFPIPPLPLYSPSRVICMNATLEETTFLKTFEARQQKRGDVSFIDGNDTEWHKDAKVFQLRTNGNPRKTLLTAEKDAQGDWIYTGMTATGKGYMDMILKSLSETHGTKAFISHKIIVELYRDALDAMGVKVGWFGGLSGLDEHFDRDKADGITLHILGTPEIPPHETAYRMKLLGLTAEQVHDASVKAELMQAVGRAGLVKNPSRVFLWTSIELPSVTHREQTRLFDDTDMEVSDAELDSIITEREAQEAQAAEATEKGDVQAVKDSGIPAPTAYRRTKASRKQSKADRDAEICDRYNRLEQTQQEISDALGIGLATVNRVLKRQPF